MKGFFGYYVKCQGGDGTVSVIFGRSSEASFIQVITEDESYYEGFNSTDCQVSKRNFGISVGQNRVDENGMMLDIKSDKLTVRGEVKFGRFTRLPGERDGWRRCAGESIMGPFQYLPFMECRHMIVSMHHEISGFIEINGRIYNFDNGIGYIEGDRGRGFPIKYFWSQAHGEDIHISASCAVIPYLGIRFKGTICVVLFRGHQYRLATYHGAKVERFESDMLVIRQKKYKLVIQVLDGRPVRPLMAPTRGKMSRVIHESVGRRVRYQFIREDETVFDFTAERAAYEFSVAG